MARLMPESYVVIGKVGYIPFSDGMLSEALRLCEKGFTVLFIENVGIFVTGKSPMQVDCFRADQVIYRHLTVLKC